MRTNGFNNSGIPFKFYSNESACDDDGWEWGDDDVNDWDDEDKPSEKDWNWGEGWHKLEEESSRKLKQTKSKPKSKLLPESSKPKNSSKFSQKNDEEDNDLKMAILLSQMQTNADADAIQQAILLSQTKTIAEDAHQDKPQDVPSTTLYNKHEQSSLRRRNITNSKSKRSSDYMLLPEPSKPSYSSNLFQNNNDDEDKDLQMAILLSQTQTAANDYKVPESSKTSYSSNLFQKNNDEEDDDLQMAILLSQTKADAAAADEEHAIQQALFLSMESLSITSDSDKEYCLSSSSAEPRSDWADLISPNSGGLKLKGVCRPLEMKPLVKLSNFQLGEASISVCVVCSNEASTGKMTRLSEKCSHFCCDGCASECLSRAIKENIQEPRCPGANCKEILPWQKCCAFIPPEVVERRFKALEEAKALMNLAEKKAFNLPFWGNTNINGWEGGWHEDDWTDDLT